MKNIFKLMLLPAFALPLVFTACDEDTDSNPTLDLSHVSEGFVLNTPAYAANNTYDLSASETITLTCSQPNYGGVPYAVRYFVQVAIEEDAFTAEDGSYTELSTSYTSASMSVDATEFNDAIVALYQEANPYDEEVPVMAVYVRLRAVIDALEDLYDDNPSETYSNVITLPSVKAEYEAPDAELPEYMYVCGSSIQNAWTSWKPVPPVYGVSGSYYTLVYFGAGDSFAFGTTDSELRGYSLLNSVTDDGGAGLSESEDGYILVDNAGWYVLNFDGTISDDNKSIAWDLSVYTGAAYIIGALEGGSWTDSDSSCAMTVPSSADGEWVSPAFSASGELRAYIKVGSYDWWRTEFTLYEGDLYWRLVDIVDNWETNVGSEYSVQGTTGQKLYVNFNWNTGYIE